MPLSTFTVLKYISCHNVLQFALFNSSSQVNCLKLSETVEKGKHPEKFGLAENKAGPDREYILQVGDNWGNTFYSS